MIPQTIQLPLKENNQQIEHSFQEKIMNIDAITVLRNGLFLSKRMAIEVRGCTVITKKKHRYMRGTELRHWGVSSPLSHPIADAPRFWPLKFEICIS